MNVRYAPRARGDLATILAYIEERSPSGARNVAASIRTTAALLSDFPLGGVATHRADLRVKIVPLYGYKLYYRHSGDDIEIVHIRHAARRPLR